MDQTTIFLLAGIFVLILGGVLLYAARTNDKVAGLIPPEVAARLLDQGDRLLQVALTNAASTPSEFDDQALITLLSLRGWRVTGDADSGYVVTKDSNNEASG